MGTSSLRIVAAAIAGAALTACGRSPDSASAAPPAASSSAAPPSSFSVYDLGATWRDQTGAARQLASLKGKPRLLSLVYTSCTSICPMTVAAMQEVEAKAGDRAGYVLVSLDPERDSPARLADYARQHQLSNRWTLFSGAENDVRELAALLHVQYRRVSPDEIDHSATLTILDADGRIVAQFDKADAVDRAAEVLLRFPVPAR
ncbi:MAG: SCO family protein [Gemmatimonadota bacterium]|nr:SCO family protein [Gemmatimonadota bacterium]